MDQTPSTVGRLLTINETAERTRTPVATLRFWRHVGDMGPQSFKVGRRVVYAESDVEAWIASARAEATRGQVSA